MRRRYESYCIIAYEVVKISGLYKRELFDGGMNERKRVERGIRQSFGERAYEQKILEEDVEESSKLSLKSLALKAI